MFKKLFNWGKKNQEPAKAVENLEVKEELIEDFQNVEEEKADEIGYDSEVDFNMETSAEGDSSSDEKVEESLSLEIEDEIPAETITRDEIEIVVDDVEPVVEQEDVIVELTEELPGEYQEEVCDNVKSIIDEENIQEEIQHEIEVEVQEEELPTEIELNEPKDSGEKVSVDVEEAALLQADDEELIEEKQEERSFESSIKEEPPVEGGFFARLKAGLSKTTKNFSEKLSAMLECYEGVNEDVYEELEEIMIMADIGFETTNYIIENLRKRVLDKSISDTQEVKVEIQSIISEILSQEDSSMNIGNGPTIVTIVGVNGVGKTTTIGKLANKYKNNGEKVILAAADTFRAAASEQLEIWAKRSNVDIVKHGEGADPSAVIFDGIKAAKARNASVLICDTAGRLHNKKNLMMELGKIFRIIDREYEEANKEVLLVIDATTGQNAISQVKLFKEVAPLTGIILTKLDGTAKGGVVIGIIKELGLPIKYIGVGERLDDLQEFSSEDFAKALFDN